MENGPNRGIDPSRFRRHDVPNASVRVPQPGIRTETLPKLRLGNNLKWLRWLMLGLISAVILGAVSFGLSKVLQPNPLIPNAITSKVSFAIFYPTDHSIVTADQSTIKYDAANNVLSFVAWEPNDTKLTFSEQSTPGSFVDIPQAYDTLIAKLNGYSSLDSVNGTVHLVHPKELNGGQAAAMNAKGTLLFAKPSSNLSDDQWRKVFNNLQITK